MAILAAIDESERSKRVLTVAHDLATAYDDTLVALHVVPEDNYEEHRESLQQIREFNEFSITQEVESAKEIARRFAVETLDEDFDSDLFEPAGRVGNVTEEILSAVTKRDPRFLVIGGRRRSPAGKALFGNTAQQLLLNADCPVVSNLRD